MKNISDDYIRSLYGKKETVARTIPTPDALDESFLQQYREQGFLVVDNVYNPQEIQLAVSELNSIINGTIQGPQVEWRNKPPQTAPMEGKYKAVRKIQNFIDFSEPLKQLAHHPAILNITEKLLGEPAEIAGNMALLKPASKEAGVEKPWHQDMAYGPFALTRMVCGVWIALDDADMENGCMHVIPGSHREGPIPHYAIRDWQLCDTDVRLERDEAIPMKAGSALFFSGLLHHGTPPNESTRGRRALQFHFKGISSEKMEPKEYKRAFTNEMTNAEC